MSDDPSVTMSVRTVVHVHYNRPFPEVECEGDTHVFDEPTGYCRCRLERWSGEERPPLRLVK